MNLRFGDVFRQSAMVFTEQTGLMNLYSMINYCVNETACKRKMIANHFNDTTWSNQSCNKMCCNCRNENKRRNYNYNFINEVRCIIDILDKTTAKSTASKEKRLTANKLSELAFAEINKKLTLFRQLSDANSASQLKYKLTEYDIEKLILNMVLNDYLREEFHFTPYNTICYIVKSSKSEQNSGSFYMTINVYSSESQAFKSSKNDDCICLDEEDNEFLVMSSKKRKKSYQINDETKDDE